MECAPHLEAAGEGVREINRLDERRAREEEFRLATKLCITANLLLGRPFQLKAVARPVIKEEEHQIFVKPQLIRRRLVVGT